MKNIFCKTHQIKVTKNLAVKVAAWVACPAFFWLMGWNPLSTTRGVGLALGSMATVIIGIAGHLAADDLYKNE